MTGGARRRVLHLFTAAAGWFADLIRADNLRLGGEHAAAARTYEALTHGQPPVRQAFPVDPGAARAWCWHHALAADALGSAADTTWLRGIADSLETSRGMSTPNLY